MSKAHKDPRWTRLARRRVNLGRINDEPCHSCGQPIDYSLSGNARWGPTADHPDPLAWGGELLPPVEVLNVVHRVCAQRQGGRITAQKRRHLRPVDLSAGGEGSARSLPDTHRGTGDPPTRPSWWPADLHEPPTTSTLPRIETPHHPNAVGTYGPRLCGWVREKQGIELRWFQRYAAARLLEHDEEGRLLWAEAGFSTARQSGKSILLRSLASWRMHEADLLGEVQTVLHVSNNLGVVNEVAMPALVWAEGQGYHVRRTNGEVEIRLPDGSRWVPRSSRSAYGLSVGCALVDECWDLQPLVVDSMIVPTMLERAHPQMVLFSTAHPNATSLFPTFRTAGSAADSRLVLEWSAPRDADREDPATWRLASPEWSEQRQRILARQIKRIAPDDFAAQFLNIWPEVTRDATDPAPFPGWSSMPRVEGDPPFGALVALDEFYDGSGAGVAAFDGSGFWYREAGSLESAVSVATRWTDGEVLVGMSLKGAVGPLGVAHPVPFGARQTSLGIPLLLEAVKRGEFAHEHTEALAAQAAGARVKVADSGAMSLSVKSSTGSVLPFKLAAWLLLHERDSGQEAAAIW